MNGKPPTIARRRRGAKRSPGPARPAEPLLKTKLFLPQLGQVITRPRLLERMEAGAIQPLTLVSGPPGYGKTTLVVEAVARSGRPCAWLSLDERDNDPVRFFTYLIAALGKVDRNTGQAAHSLLARPQLPTAEALATSLINDLSGNLSPDTGLDIAAPEPGFWLVLDDYHAIRSPFIHDAVELMVQHAPPNLHVILVTRQDPSFAVARLRVRGRLVEIRAEDLRFTHDEAAEWFNLRLGLHLNPDAVAALHARTEGWIAGLQLAGVSLQGRDAARVAEFIEDFGGSDRYVLDYLVEEVLRQQPDERRQFLCQTAILDRFNASLCDALTGRTDSKALLGQLERANLFLIPLDGRREWFRYHHLFADFLCAELDASEQLDLHQKAAQWYDAHDLRAEAIEHALLAEQPQAAAGWIEQAASGLLQRGELATLSRWLAAMPDALIRQNINLNAYQAWTLYFGGQFAEAEARADVLAALEAPGETSARGRVAALLASIAGHREDWSACAAHGQRALELIGDADPFFRIMVVQALGDAERHAGHAEAATRLFREGFELAERMDLPFSAVIALTALAPNLSRQGQRREALAYCRRAQERYVDSRGEPLPIAGTLHVPLGMLHYAANELELADQHIRQGLALYKELRLDRIAVGDGEWTLVQILCAQGEQEAALRLAREAQRLAASSKLTRIALLMAAAVADVQLKMGDLASAARWAEEAEAFLPIPPKPAYEIAYLTLARILLARQRHNDALRLLGDLARSAEQDGRYGRLIPVYVLQALAHEGLGGRTAALECLSAAVQIAAPEGYVRAFLDEGPAVANLLPHVRSRAPAFVDSLLTAFGREQKPGQPSDRDRLVAGARNDSSPDGQTCRPPSGIPQRAGVDNGGRPPASYEALSERELEVLRHLADGKSNADIAQALVMTVGTAKWHVHHILEKLDAENRTQAVVRARELDLL